jgi:hypothetical protein
VDASGVRDQNMKVYTRDVMSQDAVAEFRVSTALHSANTGGTGGGQVEIVTKSGSNAFHGSAFEHLRNNVFDARSPFDPAQHPPFRLNQFGPTLGGAVIKNKIFFFLSYEGIRLWWLVCRGFPVGGQSINEWTKIAALSTPAHGTWGNAGPDIVTGPRLFQIDAALAKETRIRERVELIFRADIFNVFSHPELGAPNLNYSAPATFGRITSLLNTSPIGTGGCRSIQLALRLAF